MKKIGFFLAAPILLICTLAFASHAKADSPMLSFSAVGGNMVENTLNSTNTSFIINSDLATLTAGYKAKLYIGTALLREYTSSALETYEMPSGSPGDFFPEGLNIISLKIYNATDVYISQEDLPIVADYTAPTGTITYKTKSTSKIPNTLKIGDFADFTFVPDTAGEKIASITWSYNGKKLSSIEAYGGISLLGEYAVEEGDQDQTTPLPLRNVVIEDTAGNISVIASTPVNFTIDANSPKIICSSPENGKTYTTRDIQVSCSVNEHGAFTVYKNGIDAKIQNGGYLVGLADGQYDLRIETEDPAGNAAIVYTNFAIDVSAPDFTTSTNPDGGKVEQGSTIVFEGTSEPNANILVEIFSDSPVTGQTTVGVDGKWRLEICSRDLTVGSHEAYLAVSDQFSNSFRKLIATFDVYKPKPVRVALALSHAKQTAEDVTSAITAPATVKAGESKTEVAKSGSLISSEDTRQAGTNWSAWIILLGLVVLASALATAGYYGYEWVSASAADREDKSRDATPEDFSIELEDAKPEMEEEVEVKNRPPTIQDNKPETNKEIEETKPDDFEPPPTRW